jgi:hypothetical protein
MSSTEKNKSKTSNKSKIKSGKKKGYTSKSTSPQKLNLLAKGLPKKSLVKKVVVKSKSPKTKPSGNTKNTKPKNIVKTTQKTTIKFWELFWDVFERSRIPSLARNSEGKLLKLNKSAQNLIGYTLEEIPDTKNWISKLYEPILHKNIKKIINDSFIEKDAEQY